MLGPDGTAVVPIMGSYGIGVERAIAVIAETHHDDAGLVWPPQVAPADVHVLLLSVRDEGAPDGSDGDLPAAAGGGPGRAAG